MFKKKIQSFLNWSMKELKSQPGIHHKYDGKQTLW